MKIYSNLLKMIIINKNLQLNCFALLFFEYVKDYNSWTNWLGKLVKRTSNNYHHPLPPSVHLAPTYRISISLQIHEIPREDPTRVFQTLVCRKGVGGYFVCMWAH